MQCPNCRTRALRQKMTRQGVEVDACGECGGVWLDKGELLHFAGDKRAVSRKLDEALKKQVPGGKLSPRSGAPMTAISYDGRAALDYCPKSGGLWLDKKALKAVLGAEKSLRMETDEKALKGLSMAGKPMLASLPNLFLRSTVTLTGLYGVLVLALILVVEVMGAPLEGAVLAGVGFIVIQFLISPFIMDLMLRWIYSVTWVKPSQLPPHIRTFAQRIADQHNIKFPRFGVIDDGAPQAFTYGHVPSNARIVLSRGIFELLSPEEAESVVAHEMGHAIHWDMILMTMAQMVPLILYYIYRALIRAASSSNSKNGGGAVIIAIGVYVVYIISEYVVLWFSRTREYHADRFAGDVTGNPSLLASALAKIAYGLAGQEKAAAKGGEDEKTQSARGAYIGAIGAMGIFDSSAAKSLAIASYSPSAAASGEVDKGNLKGAMRWDLWNPWARWFELNSTHPLIAKRLRHLSNQSQHMGQEPFVVFDEAQPESYWDEFLVDLFINMLPTIMLVLTPLYFAALLDFEVFSNPCVSATLAAFGLAKFIKLMFIYEGKFFPEMSVAALLKKVKVSGVRPIPCTIKGDVIGKGVPGYIFSEDFVMRDDTGIMFLDYRQPLALWEFFFGLLKAGEYQGEEVLIQGWYRRAPIPYIEIKTIAMNGKTRRCWTSVASMAMALAIAAVGAAGLLGLIDFAAIYSAIVN